MEIEKTGTTRAPFVPNEFLVKFKPGTPSGARAEFSAIHGVDEKEAIDKINVHVIKVPPGKTVSEMVKACQNNPNVAYAEPNYVCYANIIPNDPYFKFWQAPLQRMRAPEAWDSSTGSADILIAVLDTGAATGHEDLAGRLMTGYNFISNHTNAEDDHGHGTKVTGIVGAQTNNGKGVAGVTWVNPLMPVKVLAADGSGTYSGVAKGIIYATDQGARVINMSLAGPIGSQTLRDAVDYAHKRNVVLVAGAGNTNSSVLYPAAYPNVMAVAAVDSSDNKADYSCFGPEISVAAPGNGIFTTIKAGGYDMGAGTSMATPFVAGLAAIILSLKPGLTATEVRSIIESGADDLGEPGWDPYFGWGRINMAKSIALLEMPDTPSAKDTEPPVVSIVSPKNGETVSGTVMVEILATDNDAVAHVEVIINGSIVATLHNFPYTFDWNTENIASGSYRLEGKATDMSGNSAMSAAVTVNKQEASGETFTFTGSVSNKKQGTQAEHVVQIKKAGPVRAALSWATRKTNLDLYLYDPTGQLVAKAAQSTEQILREDLAAELTNPGIYRFRIQAVSGNASYTLTVNTP